MRRWWMIGMALGAAWLCTKPTPSHAQYGGASIVLPISAIPLGLGGLGVGIGIAASDGRPSTGLSTAGYLLGGLNLAAGVAGVVFGLEFRGDSDLGGGAGALAGLGIAQLGIGVFDIAITAIAGRRAAEKGLSIRPFVLQTASGHTAGGVALRLLSF